MAPRKEQHRTSNRPGYIVWVVGFVIVFTLLQGLVNFGTYYALYGLPTFAELVTMRVPDYSHAVLWKGRIWHGVLKLGPGAGFGRATLMSLDPEKGGSTESHLTVPFPNNGLLLENDRLWAIARSSVVLIEGDDSKEFQTRRVLTRPSDPFLYEDQLAVIEMGNNSPPTLLVFQNNDWVELGPVAIPLIFASAMVNGQPTLISVPATAPLRASLLDVQVVSSNGEQHVFVSDGMTVAYRKGLEVAPASALAPANVPAVVDLANLKQWEAICTSAARLGPARKSGWKVSIVDGEPVLIVAQSLGTQRGGPFQVFQPVQLVVYRQSDGLWHKSTEVSTPSMLEMLAVSDGKTMYVAGQSVVQTLRFLKLQGQELNETGIVTKAPVAGFQSALEQFLLIWQWIFWVGLLPFAMGISRLMTLYCSAAYQFGKTDVELASYLRRGIARAIDHFLYVIPNYFVAVAYGFGKSQAEMEKEMDKIFDFSPNGMLVRLASMMLVVLIVMVTILVVNSIFQGRWGVTVGKWICGIRTVGTTLRPCGFLRAALRELLLVVETGMGATIIPATLFIAINANRRRVGDMVADTIVIRKRRTEPEAEMINDESSFS